MSSKSADPLWVTRRVRCLEPPPVVLPGPRKSYLHQGGGALLRNKGVNDQRARLGPHLEREVENVAQSWLYRFCSTNAGFYRRKEKLNGVCFSRRMKNQRLINFKYERWHSDKGAGLTVIRPLLARVHVFLMVEFLFFWFVDSSVSHVLGSWV